MSIASNLEKIKKEIPSSVTLVAISKTKPVSMIQEAFAAGQLHFGENRVQEMTEKHSNLPEEILWHQVGHLQSNKVKYLAPYVHLIHSIDSMALLAEVQKQGLKNDRRISILLQVYIASEETKFGLDEEELFSLLNDKNLESLSHVHIKGLMGMATNTGDEIQVGKEFGRLKKIYDKVSAEFSNHSTCQWETLSMGMSSDYLIAISEGSNMVRIGSAIFGDRVL